MLPHAFYVIFTGQHCLVVKSVGISTVAYPWVTVGRDSSFFLSKATNEVMPLGCDTKKDVLSCIVKNKDLQSPVRIYETKLRTHLPHNQLVLKKKKQDEKTKKAERYKGQY